MKETVNDHFEKQYTIMGDEYRSTFNIPLIISNKAHSCNDTRNYCQY